MSATGDHRAWDSVMEECLNAIDRHIAFYAETGDPWHFCQANRLKQYVEELKDWIVGREGKNTQ